jgi:hypothetical protein
MMWMAGAGVRIRLIDPQDGYSNEENGDIAGGFWVSAHIGVHQFDGIQIGLDGALGYDLSIARPFSMGFFVRGYLLFAGDGKPAVGHRAHQRQPHRRGALRRPQLQLRAPGA